MPASSVRDIIIKDDDLAAGTHGRGFWILDNITPLRQIDSSFNTDASFLFKPQVAMRVRWDMNTDTPLPPDFPAGDNPPEGAMIDYYLPSGVAGPVTLEIRDAGGKSVRRYSSADPVGPIDPMLAIPRYWVRPPQALPGAPGMHRFLWDMHYPPVPGIDAEYPIAAVPHNTAPQATSPWAIPGSYTAVLTANGKSYSQPLTVKMDPRVKATSTALAGQFQLSMKLYQTALMVTPAAAQSADLQKQVKELLKTAQGDVLAAAKALDQKLEAAAGRATRRPGVVSETLTLGAAQTRVMTLLGILQEVDAAPTTQATAAAAELEKAIAPLMQRWEAIRTQDVPALNDQLRKAGLPELKVGK